MTWPLLRRELNKLADQRQLYVIRSLFALVILGGGCIAFALTLWEADFDPIRVLGQGRWMFDCMVYIQFASIAIATPLLVGNAITDESDRGTLSVLLVSNYTTTRVLFEKLVGRLVPIWIGLLASMPLIVIPYTIGGVTWKTILTAELLIFIGSIQLGAICIMCSAYCRDGSAALISCFLFAGVFYMADWWASIFAMFSLIAYIVFFPIFFLFLFYLWITGQDQQLEHVSTTLKTQTPRLLEFIEQFSCLPPHVYFAQTDPQLMLLYGSPIIASIAVFLLIARRLIAYRAIDARFATTASSGIWKSNIARRMLFSLLCRDHVARLPGDAPVAWRELQRKILKQPLITTLTLFCCAVLTIAIAFRGDLKWFTIGFWIASVVLMVSESVNAIVSERTRQTLPTLLTTPLSPSAIVRQKALGLRLLGLLLLIPFFILLSIGYDNSDFNASASFRLITDDGWFATHAEPLFPILAILVYLNGHIGGSICVYMVYLPMFSWLAMSVGLRCRNTLRGITITLAIITLWIVVPPIVLIGMSKLGFIDTGLAYAHLMMVSPGMVVAVLEEPTIRQAFPTPDWLIPLLGLPVHFVLWLVFRGLCLRDADRLLRRP